MAKAKVGAAGIEYIQGALKKPKKVNGHNHGNYFVATHRTAPTTNPNCQRIYSFDADRYQRSTPPSADEIEMRSRFASIATAVAARMKNLSTITADQAAFYAQKENGIPTFKAYIWSLEKARYDEQHG